MKNSSAPADAELQVVRLLQREADAERPDFSRLLHARIMQAVSRQQAVSARATAVPQGVGRGSWTSCEQLARWTAAVAVVVMMVLFFVWRPLAVDTHTNHMSGVPWETKPLQASFAVEPELAEHPLPDSVVDAFDHLSTATSWAGDWIVQTVADPTVMDRHWAFWSQNAQLIGDALLDPLPISWEPGDSERTAAVNENS